MNFLLFAFFLAMAAIGNLVGLLILLTATDIPGYWPGAVIIALLAIGLEVKALRTALRPRKRSPAFLEHQVLFMGVTTLFVVLAVRFSLAAVWICKYLNSLVPGRTLFNRSPGGWICLGIGTVTATAYLVVMAKQASRDSDMPTDQST